MKYLGQENSQRQQVDQWLQKGVIGNYCLMGTEYLLQVMKNFGDSGDGCTHCENN